MLLFTQLIKTACFNGTKNFSEVTYNKLEFFDSIPKKSTSSIEIKSPEFACETSAYIIFARLFIKHPYCKE